MPGVSKLQESDSQGEGIINVTSREIRSAGSLSTLLNDGPQWTFEQYWGAKPCSCCRAALCSETASLRTTMTCVESQEMKSIRSCREMLEEWDAGVCHMLVPCVGCPRHPQGPGALVKAPPWRTAPTLSTRCFTSVTRPGHCGYACQDLTLTRGSFVGSHETP